MCFIFLMSVPHLWQKFNVCSGQQVGSKTDEDFQFKVPCLITEALAGGVTSQSAMQVVVGNALVKSCWQTVKCKIINIQKIFYDFSAANLSICSRVNRLVIEAGRHPVKSSQLQNWEDLSWFTSELIALCFFLRALFPLFCDLDHCFNSWEL